MSDYTPLKCGVIWSGIVAAAVAVMLPTAVMVNHYNDTEASRANACTEQHGVYVDGKCVWTSR